jgi:hypothetical protein
MRKLIVIAGLVSVVGAAQAASFITLYEFDNVAAGYQYNVNVKGGTLKLASGRSGIDVALDMTAFGGGSFARRVYAGVLNMDIQDPIPHVKNRDFMCVEVDRSVRPSDALYARHDTYGRVGWLVKEMAKYRSNKDAMAGLQLAIWEVAYDTSNGNGDNLGGGIFRVINANAATLAWANSFLAASDGKQKGYAYYSHPLPGTTGTQNYQDLVSIVPGPAAMAPFLIGLISLRRKRK